LGGPMQHCVSGLSVWKYRLPNGLTTRMTVRFSDMVVFCQCGKVIVGWPPTDQMTGETFFNNPFCSMDAVSRSAILDSLHGKEGTFSRAARTSSSSKRLALEYCWEVLSVRGRSFGSKLRTTALASVIRAFCPPDNVKPGQR
jgi:hypothetical protein